MFVARFLYPHTWGRHPLVHTIIQHVEYSAKMARVNKSSSIKRHRTLVELPYPNGHELIFAQEIALVSARL